MTVLTLMLFNVGCKKDTPVASSNTTKVVSLAKIDNDLKIINAKYAPKSSHARTTQKLGSGKAWVVAGADVIGGGTAFAQTNQLCYTGIWGGIVCGLWTVGSAAVCSGLAYYTCYGASCPVSPGAGGNPNDPNNPDNSNNPNYQTIINEKAEVIANVDHYSVPNPYNNPYDATTGVQHNQMVKILFSHTPSLTPLTYNTLAFLSSDLTQNQLSAFAFDTAHIIFNIDSFIISGNFIGSSGGSLNYVPLINHFFANDTTLQNITTTFFDGFSQITDETSAMSFINDYENYFINTQTNLSSSQSNVLLTEFSIAKYSYAMWFDALSVN